MRIVACEPYFTGSHRAFLETWVASSRHEWQLFSEPGHHWKWRMRHSAVSFADALSEAWRQGRRWDLLWCSDMVNLAELIGLLPAELARLPRVVYFHENQLTYPVRHDDERDIHFGLINMTTALAADVVWFNSAWHGGQFVTALREWLSKMPAPQLLEQVDRIAERLAVQPPPVNLPACRGRPGGGPIRIGWVGRWEHDKQPEIFFEAIRTLAGQEVDFRLIVIGEQFREVPEVFAQARRDFSGRIDRWGHQPTREEYEAALGECDVMVSTAGHEFFGLAMVEAAAAGAFPLLPDRLAYPEVFAKDQPPGEQFFYDGSAGHLAERLGELADRYQAGALWMGDSLEARRRVERYGASRRAGELDDALQALTTRAG